MRWQLFFSFGIVTLFGSEKNCSARTDASDASGLAYALSTRYAPYANWQKWVDPAGLKPVGSVYWRTSEVIQAARLPDEAPLAGLHLALDPGHIGGAWAEAEGRHFQINTGDFPVREGDLVLEVAEHAREQLQKLGAKITLLRDDARPVNPRPPSDCLEAAFSDVGPFVWDSWSGLESYLRAVRNRALRLSIVIGDLAERARIVNEVIHPDAVLSIHINAAPWPPPMDADSAPYRLVDSNHVHVLIFGCMSDQELASERQREALLRKLLNGSGAESLVLGDSLGKSLAAATGLPASRYAGKNAIQLKSDNPYLFARNLMLLRLVECPIVLLEPYIANSHQSYSRIQKALADREANIPLAADDILIEYTNAIVRGILDVYGPEGAPD